MLRVNNKANITTSSRSGVFIVNFEHISHLLLVFLTVTLNRLMLVGRFQIFVSVMNLMYVLYFNRSSPKFSSHTKQI